MRRRTRSGRRRARRAPRGSSRSWSTRPARRRSSSASWPTACATPTSGRSSTATGAPRSRCCSATRRRASSRRSATASITSPPAIACCWPGRCPAASVRRAARGRPRRCAHGWEQPQRLHTMDGRPLVGTLSIGGLATHTVVHAAQVIPVPAETRARSGVPPRLRRIHRRRRRGQHRARPAGRHGRRDRPRRHRAVRPPGRAAGGRRRG